jgi:hypothetical protein
MTVPNPKPLHPGRVLAAVWPEADYFQFGDLVAGKTSATPELAVKLEMLTGLSALVWLRLQAEYDRSEQGEVK